MKPRRSALPKLSLLAALTAAILAACAHEPAPARFFRPTPEQIGPEFNSYGEAVLPEQGLIVVQGDDLAYGVAVHPTRHRINDAEVGQASRTISQSLRHVLGDNHVRVENRGFPDDTVTDSAKRWQGLEPGDLMVLAYGFGDLKAKTKPAEFAENLRAQIRAAHARGAAVFVVSPPSVADPQVELKLSAYRWWAETVAGQEGAESFSAVAAMAAAKEQPAKGAPQNAKTYETIAAAMVPYIKLVKPQS
jgi:lysophospholipase L1-like esterase